MIPPTIILLIILRCLHPRLSEPPWHAEGSLVALLPALDASGISLIFPAALVLGLLPVVAPLLCRGKFVNLDLACLSIYIYIRIFF